MSEDNRKSCALYGNDNNNYPEFRLSSLESRTEIGGGCEGNGERNNSVNSSINSVVCTIKWRK